jgi:flagellin-like protein
MNMKMKRKMNKIRKALSPVVASIILIAVTVAVSIAVAAWMGALTFNFMATEQIKITNLQFTQGAGPVNNLITITLLNTGTNPVTISEVHMNNGVNVFSTASPAWTTGVVAANGNVTETFTLSPAAAYWVNGAQYEVELRSSKGNQFTYTATAPS